MNDIDLDRPDTYGAHDPDEMYRRVNDLPEQLEDAWELVGAFPVPHDYRSASRVLIAGMGGSAIGGSLLESYAALDASVPINVWRSYGLPGYVDDKTLVIAVSYSGNTEETLSAFEAARDRGAKLLAVTTGGRLADLADDWKVPVLRFSYAAQPRATLGYLMTPLVGIVSRLGWIPVQEEAMNAAFLAARNARTAWQASVPTERNLAKQLARDCQGNEVVIYGAEYLGAVARRWKTQMNENAKNWAFWEEFSELNHNAIVGYSYPISQHKVVQVLVLRGRQLSEPIQRRIEITEHLLREHAVPYHLVDAEGNGRLAEMVYLIALGDYTSYYLALLNGADPTTIAPIDYLKKELERRG